LENKSNEEKMKQKKIYTKENNRKFRQYKINENKVNFRYALVIYADHLEIKKK